MKKDLSMLTKYLPLLESRGAHYDWRNDLKLLEEINKDSMECLKQYEELDRGPKTNEYLLYKCRTSGQDVNMSYFNLNVSQEDDKTVVGLINMAYALDRWNGNLVYSVFDDGTMYGWLKRLAEIEKEDK